MKFYLKHSEKRDVKSSQRYEIEMDAPSLCFKFSYSRDIGDITVTLMPGVMTSADRCARICCF